MTDKSEWQEANRELLAEERRKLGAPPTAEEMLAFTRGELSESEEERIRDLLVAYPELARMYSEPFPDEPRPGDPDFVPEEQVAQGWSGLEGSLRKTAEAAARGEAQRGRVSLQYVPTAIAAMLALVCFGLFVRAEGRARYYQAQSHAPKVLAAPQELDPDGNRGAGAPTMLRRDGEAYLLKPRLINQVRHPHYQVELHDTRGALLWKNRTAQPDADDTFQIVVPHPFLREGEDYRLLIFGVDGESPVLIGTYDLTVPVE
ncbi:MAG TPA: hypothetical protein VFP80_11105 [Thermoanaerobaculia bacterium]|nr:hypothetical protein [Thermoanaerobaculia bacterium]